MIDPLPILPLLLWETPPGLELALRQEGVPFVHVRDAHPLSFARGRFVLVDGKSSSTRRVLAALSPHHVTIDVDAFRRGERLDPFVALVDTRGASAAWNVEGLTVTERVSRYPKAKIRRRLVEKLRAIVEGSGGIWARIAAYPFPYRSAFNLRIDLDEPEPDDYDRFAEVRRPIDDCTTHFLCTSAYGHLSRAIEDLHRVDVQSHGHYHFVYREPIANRRNLDQADRILRGEGFAVEGFAGPHGRWNPGLDSLLEEIGYLYSSDFQLGYDDVPFYPWRGDRFSHVLQVPVHPLCEGVFFEAGGTPDDVARHLTRVVRAKVAAGEPAFVYGHPEGRLGRYPEIVTALAEAVAGQGMVWRTTLTAFARWWRWRGDRAFSVISRGDGRFEVQCDEWDPTYPIALEVARGRHVASIPLAGPRTTLALSKLAYERREPVANLPEPIQIRGRKGFRAAVRSALDWETVTPVGELSTATIAGRVKRELRRWRDSKQVGVDVWDESDQN